jgi:hypothetical protein
VDIKKFEITYNLGKPFYVPEGVKIAQTCKITEVFQYFDFVLCICGMLK